MGYYSDVGMGLSLGKYAKYATHAKYCLQRVVDVFM